MSVIKKNIIKMSLEEIILELNSIADDAEEGLYDFEERNLKIKFLEELFQHVNLIHDGTIEILDDLKDGTDGYIN